MSRALMPLIVLAAALPLAAAADLIGINVLDDVNTMGMFTFSLTCMDTAQMQVKWIDDDLFRETMVRYGLQLRIVLRPSDIGPVWRQQLNARLRLVLSAGLPQKQARRDGCLFVTFSRSD